MTGSISGIGMLTRIAKIVTICPYIRGDFLFKTKLKIVFKEICSLFII
jgi:hypothetical protein